MHRNSQKRIYIPEAIYFLTTKTKDNFPYFKDVRLAELLMQEIGLALKIKQFRVFAYVIITDHLHILLQPVGKCNISQCMFTIKKQFTHEANRLLGFNSENPAPHHVGERTFVRLRKYIHDNKNTYAHGNNHPRLHFEWQSSFHDHIIRSDEDLYTHIEYIRYNPEKHGLVKSGEPYRFLFVDDSLLTA